MLKTSFIRATFRKPVRPPPWWEGHTIAYKVYPFGHGNHGCCTVNLCDPGGGRQKQAPYTPGQFITVSVGGKRMRGQVESVDIHRPGYATSHAERDTFDPDEDPGEWLIEVAFPKIQENKP